MESLFGLKEIRLRDRDMEVLLRGHIVVKPRELFLDVPLPCDIRFPTMQENHLTLETFLKKGDLFQLELLNTLKNERIDELYIDKSDEDLFFNYFNSQAQASLQSSSVAPETKTQILYDNAAGIVKKVFRERPNPENIRMGKQLVGNFASHLLPGNVTVDALSDLFSKDYYTFSHCVQVAVLGMTFCKYLGWSTEEITDFGLGALFHDIGKNRIEDHILNKPGKLDKAEFEIIKQHTLLGYNQLKNSRIVSIPQLSIVLNHHEAVDGSGYPLGLKGAEIHKYARVAHIVDVYDALTTRRSYKEALSTTQALSIMNGDMRRTFDAALFGSFIQFLGKEDSMLENAKANRINIDLGNQMLLQFSEGGDRVKTILVGMESPDYVILRTPQLIQFQRFLERGKTVTVRYTHSGAVYGFRTAVLGAVSHPLRLLFLMYPKTIENINLRKAHRVDCFFPSDIRLGEKTLSGAIVDLSVGGCKFVGKHNGNGSAVTPPVDGEITMATRLMGNDELQRIAGKVRNLKMEEGKIILGIQFVDLPMETIHDLEQCIENVACLIL